MISVCIPTCNGALHIEEQLRTILTQLGPGDEVVISDDRSSDDTLGIIRALGDKRVRVFTHAPAHNPYRGPSRTIYAIYRNVEHAMAHAAGDYIFLADQDDVWLPEKVSRVMAGFDRGVELVLHDNVVVDGSGKVLMESYFDQFSHPDRNWARFALKGFYQGSAMAFTRRVADMALPFPELPLAHDQWIASVEWTHGRKISFVHEPLMLYRRHGDNFSTCTDKSPNSLGFKLKYRIAMLRALFIAAGR
jgi:glycosyltransferase involved in cell wall biosynthesis